MWKGRKEWWFLDLSFLTGGTEAPTVVATPTLRSNVQIVRRREESWHRLMSLFSTLSQPRYALWLDHPTSPSSFSLDSRTAAGHHLLTSLLSSTYWLEGQDVSAFTGSHVVLPLSVLHMQEWTQEGGLCENGKWRLSCEMVCSPYSIYTVCTARGDRVTQTLWVIFKSVFQQNFTWVSAE